MPDRPSRAHQQRAPESEDALHPSAEPAGSLQAAIGNRAFAQVVTAKAFAAAPPKPSRPSQHPADLSIDRALARAAALRRQTTELARATDPRVGPEPARLGGAELPETRYHDQPVAPPVGVDAERLASELGSDEPSQKYHLLGPEPTPGVRLDAPRLADELSASQPAQKYHLVGSESAAPKRGIGIDAERLASELANLEGPDPRTSKHRLVGLPDPKPGIGVDAKRLAGELSVLQPQDARMKQHLVDLDAPPSAASKEGASKMVVVVIGSPSPDQKHKLQFVKAALLEKGSDIVWLVERTGYELAGVDLKEITDKAPGEVRWITPASRLVDQLNALEPGSVGRLVVYSHGVAAHTTLRYDWGDENPDYGINRTDARKIKGTVFSPGATIDLESCQGGTNLTGGSLAQVIADTTGQDVSAWTGRTSYADVNAGRGPVRGSEYGLNWDAFREAWVRNWEAKDVPRKLKFRPSRERKPAPASVP